MTKTSGDAIVAAAGELIRERGFAGMSMKDIADRVGLLKGSLYSHFPSKAALVPAVLAKVAAELSDEATGAGDWLSEYRHILDRLADQLARNGKCVGLHLVYGLDQADEAAWQAVKRFFLDIEARLAAILTRGMDAELAGELARDTLTWLEGCTLWTALDGDTAPLTAARAALAARAEAWGRPVDASARALLDRIMGDWRRASIAERDLAERVVALEADYMNVQAALAGQVEADSCFR